MSRSTLFLLLLLTPCPLAAQIDLTMRWSVAGHGGHADAATDDRPSMHPGPETVPTAAIGIRRGGWRAALSVRRSTSDLILAGEESGIVTTDALRDLSLSLDLGGVIAGTAHGARLSLLGTLSRHSWSFPQFEDPSRTRWGTGLAIEAEVPLTGRWVGLVRADLERSGSLFTDDELPGDFTRRSARRRSLGVGVRWATR